MLNKIKSLASAIYNYTHVFVGAGAVAVSAVDPQTLPPKFAAGIVIASQALKVFSNWVDLAHKDAPVALKVVETAVSEAKSVAVLPTQTPVIVAKPVVASDGPATPAPVIVAATPAPVPPTS
jgi:hypothetical protein